MNANQCVLMLKVFVCMAIWILFGSVTYKSSYPKGVFGVRVAVDINSQLISYMCLVNTGKGYTHKRLLTQQEFIKFISGFWPSVYNPNKIDYFIEHELSCGVQKDAFSNKVDTYCLPFDSLWKLRYSTYPYRGNSEAGWSSNLYKPSLKQELFLYQEYGIKNIDTDYFIDTNFWKILKDVQDPEWIAKYKSLR